MASSETKAAIATALTALRGQTALTRSQVADVIGTSAVNVWRWESGEATPDPTYVGKLATLYGTTYEAIYPAPKPEEVDELERKARAIGHKINRRHFGGR